MKPKESLLYCGKSKTGYIFTFDLVLSLILAFSILLVSIFLLTKGSMVTFSDYQSLQIGSDIILVMDNAKAFDSLDYGRIEIEMEKLLPVNYNMLIRVEGDFSEGNGLIEVGGELPPQGTVMTGERAAITDDETLLKITYFIWVR